MNDASLLPLLVILGPTASGKTELGLQVAEALGGEIISADAFAVYRGLDIGTDKPSEAARRRVRHHMVDVADPTERFSAGEFAHRASAAIHEIASRGLVPLVVGGSHFWIRALLEGLFPSPPRDPDLGASLGAEWEEDPAAVIRRLEAIDPVAAARIGAHDRQRILRALEVFELTGEPLSTHWDRHQPPPVFDPLLVAPQRPRSELYDRINSRVDRLFASGLVEEVRRILASGVPVEAHALKAIGYREVVEFLEGLCNLDEAIENTKGASRKLAKRQLTWLRGFREDSLIWVPPADESGASAVINFWYQHTERRKNNE